MSATEKVCLCLIVCIAFLLRMEHIGNVPLDWPSMRQGHTAIIAWNYAEHGMNLFKPDIGGNGREPVIWYNEFSFYPYLVACVYQLTGVDTSVARFINVLASLACMIQIFRVTRRYCGANAALFAALFFAIVPLSVYYGRTIQRQQLVLFLGITMFDEFDRWLADGRWRRYWTAMIAGCLAILMNPPIALMGVPMLFLLLKQCGFRGFLDVRVIALGLVTLLPAMLWYREALQHDTSWSLQPSGREDFREFDALGYYFRWFDLEVFTRVRQTFWNEVLSPAGTLVAFASLLLLWGSVPWVFYFWALGVLLYFMLDVNPIGIYVHSYYYLNAVPILCIFAGIGLSRLWNREVSWFRDLDPLMCRLALTVLILTVFLMGRGFNAGRYEYLWEFRDVPAAAKDVDIMVPRDALIFIDKFDPAPYSIIRRQGWYNNPEDLSVTFMESMREKGCEYLLFFNLARAWEKPGMLDYLKNNTTTILQKDGYRILKFTEEMDSSG